MRFSWRLGFRLVLIIVVIALIWMRLVPHRPRTSIADLSSTSPLDQPGSMPAPAEAYPVYSALYQAPLGEPLVLAEDSITDIPQVDGSCLKPSTPAEHQMADAFVAANRQSHRWQQSFAVPSGYRLLPHADAAQAQSCLETHGKDASKCSAFSQIRHVRYLGVPGFDAAHTHALVSVIKMCGSFCGSGGIFEVEKAGSAWQRSPTTGFTRDCSWMY